MRTRKLLVRIAGHAGNRGRLKLLLQYEMDSMYHGFSRQLSARMWGPVEHNERQVSVPRRLRPMLGRYIDQIDHGGGRKRKDRRKHNRRWMPERDDCDC